MSSLFKERWSYWRTTTTATRWAEQVVQAQDKLPRNIKKTFITNHWLTQLHQRIISEWWVKPCNIRLKQRVSFQMKITFLAWSELHSRDYLCVGGRFRQPHLSDNGFDKEGTCLGQPRHPIQIILVIIPRNCVGCNSCKPSFQQYMNVNTKGICASCWKILLFLKRVPCNCSEILDKLTIMLCTAYVILVTYGPRYSPFRTVTRGVPSLFLFVSSGAA